MHRNYLSVFTQKTYPFSFQSYSYCLFSQIFHILYQLSPYFRLCFLHIHTCALTYHFLHFIFLYPHFPFFLTFRLYISFSVLSTPCKTLTCQCSFSTRFYFYLSLFFFPTSIHASFLWHSILPLLYLFHSLLQLFPIYDTQNDLVIGEINCKFRWAVTKNVLKIIFRLNIFE